MNSLKLWLTLRIHGRKTYEAHIDRQIQLARWFEQQVTTSPHFKLFAPPMLPIFNLCLKEQPFNEEQSARMLQAIVEEVTRDGKQWISTTRVNDQTVIRTMIISYLTEQKQLGELLGRLHSAAELVMRFPVRTIRVSGD